ncbi:MAG TPA: rhomboid family intramembrane serine protease [Egibacteraceae bacterium]|nr:rhomboid family intramembrane serine protease [Egibacteraceae bacterium]
MNAQPLPPSCYRHPDLQTRIGCARCGRPICIDCARPADVGVHCPECAAQPVAEDGMSPRRRGLGAAQSSVPVTFTVLAVNAAIHLAGMASRGLQERLFVAGAQYNPFVAEGEWYRLLTAAFLHSRFTITHILFNMYALYLFGPPLERESGSASFAALYVASALAGGAAYFVSGSDIPAVGASGAIFGLFGAWLAAAYRNRHTPRGRAGLRQLLTLLAINAALPLFIQGIAWEAHAGGLAAGLVIMLAWLGFGRRSGAAAVRVILAAAVAAASLAVAILA